MSGSKHRFVGMDAAVKESEFYKNILNSLGLVAPHKLLDHTNYFIVPSPKKSGRELVYYVDTGDHGQGRATLELDFAGTCAHRVIWEESVGYLYEFDKIEPEPIAAGIQFMEHLKRKLGRGFAAGEELPIIRDQAELIAKEFALHFIAEVGIRKGGVS